MRTSGSARYRRETIAGVLAGFVLLLIPLMFLSVLDIAQGGEDLTFEWSIVLTGLVIITVEHLALLILLGGERRRRGIEHRA